MQPALFLLDVTAPSCFYGTRTVYEKPERFMRMNYLKLFLCWLRHDATLLPANRQGADLVPYGRRRFFDTVPVDTLAVLIEFLSEQPHTKRWLVTVNPNDALTVLRFGGSLSCAAHRRFRTVKFDDFQCYPFLAGVFLSIASVMAPHLESLDLWPRFNRALKCKQFLALRVLVLYESSGRKAVERLLKTCGYNLRNLHLGMRSLEQRIIGTIAEHCVSLEVLDLSEVEYHAALENVWHTVGNTLLELHGRIDQYEFVHIARHCARLEKLRLDSDNLLFPSNGTILLRTLPSLKLLQLSKIYSVMDQTPSGSDRLSALLATCPSDLRIHSEMELFRSDESIDYIRVIGHRLQVFSLECDFGSFPSDISALFVNVEELTLIQRTEFANLNNFTEMKSIFVERMPNLRKLHIVTRDGPKILPALARCISSLLDFELEFYIRFSNMFEQAPVIASDFDVFLRANKHLRRIKIGFRLDNRDGHRSRVREMVLDEIANLIPLLRCHSVLREVELYSDGARPGKWSVKISNACVLLRTRRMNLLVDKLRYLPRMQLVAEHEVQVRPHF